MRFGHYWTLLMMGVGGADLMIGALKLAGRLQGSDWWIGLILGALCVVGAIFRMREHVAEDRL